MVMLPAVTDAVGKVVTPKIKSRLLVVEVTVNGTPVSGGVPLPMSIVQVPENVELPSALTAPLVASPSRLMSCG